MPEDVADHYYYYHHDGNKQGNGSSPVAAVASYQARNQASNQEAPIQDKLKAGRQASREETVGGMF